MNYGNRKVPEKTEASEKTETIETKDKIEKAEKTETLEKITRAEKPKKTKRAEKAGKTGLAAFAAAMSAVLLLCGCGQDIIIENTHSDKGKEISADAGSDTPEAGETPAGSEGEEELIAEIRTGKNSKDTGAAEIETTARVPETEETRPDYSLMVTGTEYTISNVNVRRQPSTSAGILAMLPPGTEVSVITEADDTWTEVYYEGELAYISRDYLTDDPDWQAHLRTKNGYANGQAVYLSDAWRYAEFSKINSGHAVMYTAAADRKNIIIGVNAGHGTEGGANVKTLCHPDGSPKVTGGSTAAGSTSATAVSSGMNFNDGTAERKVTLAEARILKEKLLAAGYDVLMIREEDDVQLDNVARTVICNNTADCHISIHWDGDGLNYDKGCYFMSVPDGIKHFDNVAAIWQESERLGDSLISGLSETGCKIMGEGRMDMDLTQTTYSSVPSVDIELGNQCSDHSEAVLSRQADGLVRGIDLYFGF